MNNRQFEEKSLMNNAVKITVQVFDEEDFYDNCQNEDEVFND